jgi:hypothetical protein
MPLTRSAVPFALIILVSCASPSEPAGPICPEQPAVVDPVEPTDEKVAPEPVTESAPEADEEPFATQEHGGLRVTVRVDERESESDESDDASTYVRIEVAHSGVETVDVVEREIDQGDCSFDMLDPAITFYFVDGGEMELFDASVTCVIGESVVRVNTEHTVVATRERHPGLEVLYEGSSQYTNHEGLAVSLDKREFYVEAGNLAVYRHTVEWCDEEGMQSAMLHGCVRSRPRKLTLLERVSITVPLTD